MDSEMEEPIFATEPKRVCRREEPFDLEEIRLLPFQEQAVDWMIEFEKQSTNTNARGGILSLSIGSGKTEIVLEYASRFKHSNFLSKFFLILCPTNLVDHWNRRIQRKGIDRFEILCMGFDDFKINREKDSKLFSFVDVWIIDEAHHLKNEKTVLHDCFREEMSRNDRCFLWLLTATPFVNCEQDLINLKSLCFRIDDNRDWKSIFYCGTQSEIDQQLNLPPLKEERVDLDFKFGIHERIYRSCQSLLKPDSSLVECEFLQRLSNHPFYLGTELWRRNRWKELWTSKKKKTLDMDDSNRTFDAEIDFDQVVSNVLVKYEHKKDIAEWMDRKDLFFESEKFSWIKDHCRTIKGKLVVFSRYVWTLRLLQNYLEWNDIKTERIDGSCESSQRRNKKMSRFRISKTKRVLLCSVGTCGVGLDLSFCSVAILVEPFWNKAIEDQAVRRIYRFGQKEPCFVYRLIMNKTTDEHVSGVSLGKETLKFDLGLVVDDPNLDRKE